MLADGTVLVGLTRRRAEVRARDHPPRGARRASTSRRASPTPSSATPATEPGLLPLLSVALTQVWAQRDGRPAHLRRLRRHGRARAAPSPPSPRTSGPGSTTPEQTAARACCCCGSPARGGRRCRTPPRADGGGRRARPAGTATRGGPARRGEAAHGGRRARGGRARGALPGVAPAAGLADRRRGRPRGPAPARARRLRVGRGRSRIHRSVARHPAPVGAGGGRRPGRTSSPTWRPTSWRRVGARARGRGARRRGCGRLPPTRQNRRLRWLLVGTGRVSSCSPSSPAPVALAGPHARPRTRRTRPAASALAADAQRLAADALNEDRPALALLERGRGDPPGPRARRPTGRC